MLVAVTAAKASPGVTTFSLALARRATELGRRVLFVEADPAGADVAARLGIAAEPGLASLSASLRRGQEPELGAHSQTLPGRSGPEALLAGPGRAQAAALGGLHESLLGLVAVADLAVIDLGRADPAAPAWRTWWPAATLRLVCVRPELGLLAQTRALLGQAGGAELVAIGAEPWPPAEGAEALGAPLAAALPEDSGGATAVLSGTRGLPRAWRRGLDPLLARLEPVTDTRPRSEVAG